MSDALLLMLAVVAAVVLFELTVGLRSEAQLKRVAEVLARNPLVFDVRTALEYRTGHLPGAINLPLLTVPFRARKLAQPGRPVIVYCASGTRSLLAAIALRRLGHAEVVDLGPLRNAGKLPRPPDPPDTPEG